MSLVSELKRRNVHRMAALYLGGAWLLMQVVDLLIDRGPLPEALGPLSLTVLAIGFPIALSLAWFLEVTPEGIRVDAEEETDRPATGFAGRRVDFVIIAVLAAAVLIFAYDKWWIPEPPAQSVAVLPFDNMSGDPEQEYFSDGLSDTLIHMLAQISGLKVTAKTSSFFFKDKDVDLHEIGRELNVGTILDGSVQRAGNEIRVIAQLVNAGDGTHLWSKSFDRDFDDIFDIQDEIAAEVVEALKVTLLESEEERLAQRYKPTEEAYEQFIRGRHEMDKRTATSLAAAEQHFKKAIELDPGYSLAYVNLAVTYRLQQLYGSLVFENAMRLAQPLVEKALELDPLSGEAHIERGVIYRRQASLTEDYSFFAAASKEFQEGIEMSPNTVEAITIRGEMLRREGRIEEALVQARKAAQLDPMDPLTHVRVAAWTWQTGRAEEALALFRHNIERNPELPNNYSLIAAYKAQLGHLGEAQWWRHESRKRNPGNVDAWAIECIGYLDLGDLKSAEECATELEETYPDNYMTQASRSLLYRYRGEMKQALATFESASAMVPGWRPGRVFLANLIAGQGDTVRARQVMANTFPELLEDEPHLVEEDVHFATVFAAVLHANGNTEQRDALLRAAAERVASMHRVRGAGYGIADVYVHTISGDRGLAIAGLREAIDQGWGATGIGNFFLDAWWTLRDDWKLQPLHQDPKFLAMIDELEADIAAQRQWYEENKDKPLL